MSTYRGDNPSKISVRKVKWDCCSRLLGENFLRTNHAFLAYRGDDIPHLRKMGVAYPRMWAIDRSYEEQVILIDRYHDLGVRIFDGDVDQVIRKDYLSETIGLPASLDLDFCGNISSNEIEETVRDIMGRVPSNSVICLTYLNGRDGYNDVDDRITYISNLLTSSTKHLVSLAQYATYQSKDDTSKGSPMLTVTYCLRKLRTKPIYIDLR